MAYIIREVPDGVNEGTVLRGAVKELWSYKGQEAMVAGPAETGKTYGGLTKAHAMLLKYPGCQGALVRQTQQSLYSSIIASYEKKILGPLYKTVVKPYGGEKPEWYDYPNGSRLWVGGLDNPDKVLSSERDFVYVNQAEEIQLASWEFLITRTTGRAGNVPYPQVFGDCNPGPPTHWIINRPSLKVFYSRHEDNPILFDDEGNITEQGMRSLAGLDSLTGVVKLRLRYGKWVGAEGIIYEGFDSQIHIIPRSKVPVCDRRIEVVDFGYTHPFVWQNWYIDNDRRIYIVQEIYQTQKLVEDHCKLIKRITKGQIGPEAVIADWDAEDRATFARHRGITPKPAKKFVRPGIEAVQLRHKIAGDGKARFFIVDDALVHEDKSLKDAYKPTKGTDEVSVYVWNEKKDAPVKEYDHAMDCWKMGVMYIDKVSGRRRKMGSVSVG